MLLLMTAGLRLCADTREPWTMRPTSKDMPEKYRNWSCQDQVVRVVPGNFVPFLFEDPRPEAVSVRVSASERFSVEGEGEFQGQEDFTFPLSSTREVRKFKFPDLR